MKISYDIKKYLVECVYQYPDIFVDLDSVFKLNKDDISKTEEIFKNKKKIIKEAITEYIYQYPNLFTCINLNTSTFELTKDDIKELTELAQFMIK
jgi:hypothetical protein